MQVQCQGRVSHQPLSLLYQAVQPRDVKPHLLHPFLTKRNLKRVKYMKTLLTRDHILFLVFFEADFCLFNSLESSQR